MKSFPGFRNGGFIALMAVIIISAILMLVATSVAFTGFNSRSDATDMELKAQGKTLAESCADIAILKLANDPGYSPPNESVSIGEKECTIKSVTASGNKKTIIVQSIYQNYFTNLTITLDSDNLSVTSFEETPVSWN